MHIVIVGCGRVGSRLALGLTESGHSVAIVDRRPEAFERLGVGFGGDSILGIGFDRDVLREAGIEHADAVAAVTNGDNSNILIARVAKETFGIVRVVARIYDPRRAAIYQRQGIATVAPALWTGEQVLRRLVGDAGSTEWVDPNTKISLVERRLVGGWIGKPVLSLESADIRVVAIARLGDTLLASPNLILQDGDVTYLAVRSGALDELDATLAEPMVANH